MLFRPHRGRCARRFIGSLVLVAGLVAGAAAVPARESVRGQVTLLMTGFVQGNYEPCV